MRCLPLLLVAAIAASGYAEKGKAETIELVPIALTQLRITFFPWTK